MENSNQPPEYPPAPTVADTPESVIGGRSANTISDPDNNKNMAEAPQDSAIATPANINTEAPLPDGTTAPLTNSEETNTPAEVAAPAPPVERVQIVLKDQNGNQIAFGVKSSTRMEKVQTAYADKTGRPLETLRFYFEGTRVLPQDSVGSLEMENEDIIEVMTQQIGG